MCPKNEIWNFGLLVLGGKLEKYGKRKLYFGLNYMRKYEKFIVELCK